MGRINDRRSRQKYMSTKNGSPAYCQYKTKSGRRRKHSKNDLDLPTFYKNAMRVRCVQSFSDKWLFHSLGAAEEAIKYNSKRKEFRSKKVRFERAYYCKACGGYHLTKMDNEQWQERRLEIKTRMKELNNSWMYDQDNCIIGGGFSGWHKNKC